MANLKDNRRPTIVGKAALLVIDIQKSTFEDKSEVRSIDNMGGYAERMLKARKVIAMAHEKSMPVIFIQEIHRADLSDFGRELDGDEDIHCLDNNPNTDVAKEEMGYLPSDYIVPKRRYSSFFGTDLEILLKGHKIETLIMVGGLTDVCVHYTFADGHQHDYFCRVIEDCVGGSSQEAHDASLKAMEYLQTGAILTRDEALAAMEAA